MKVSFAIHGTPGKSECWGMADDEGYLKSFYDAVGSNDENVFMDIDLRMVDGTICSYYHYLRLKNVTNNSKRPGGYVGISIRFDGEYCTDARNIYRMLDRLYQQVVCGSILQAEGNNVTYKYASFKQCQRELEKIKGMAIKALEQFSNDLRAFPQSYTPKHSNVAVRKYNIEDTGSESFHNVLLEKAEVYVSDDYPSINSQITELEKANTYKKELLDEQGRIIEKQSNDISALNGKVAQQTQEISNQKAVINHQEQELSKKDLVNQNLNTAFNTANQKITALTNKNNELQEKIKNAITDQDRETLKKCLSQLTTIVQKQNEITQLANGNNIESELHKLQKEISNIGLPLKPKTPSSKHEDTADVSNDDRSGFLKKNGKLWKTLVAVTIPILIIISISYGLWKADRQIELFMTQQQILHDDIQNIEMRLNKLEKRYETLSEPPSEPPVHSSTPGYPPITWINLRSSSSVKLNQQYTLQVMTGPKGQRKNINGGGYFNATTGALITEDNGASCKIFIPNTYQWDSVYVDYVIHEQTVIRRSIPISK